MKRTESLVEKAELPALRSTSTNKGSRASTDGPSRLLLPSASHLPPAQNQQDSRLMTRTHLKVRICSIV